MAFEDSFNSAVSGLDSSASMPQFSLPAMRGFQAPTQTPLNLSNWNFTPSDLMPQSNPPANAGYSNSGSPSWASILFNPVTGFNWLMDQADRVSAGVNNATRGMPNLLQVESNPQLLKTMPSIGDQLSTMVQNFKQGYEDPSQALTGRQVFNNDILGGKDIPYLSGIGGFAENMASNPLSYVPVPIGKIAQVTGITPALKMGFNALKDTPVLDNKIVNSATDALGKLFVKNYGASPALQEELRTATGAQSADQNNIIQTLQDMVKSSGVSKNELNNIGHVIEGTQTGTPAQMDLAQRLSQLTQNGISDTTGTQALLNRELLSPDQLRENYFRHFYNNVPDELQGVFPKSGIGIPGLSTHGTYELPRTFQTLQDAIQAGLKPELNPYLVVGKHLADTSKASINNDLIQQLKSIPGLFHEKDVIDEVKKLVTTGRMTANEAANRLGMSLDDLQKGFVESKIPQLRGAYIRPADEAALTNFLSPARNSNLYDKAMGAWKTATTFNSLVHGHNILYNGMWLGGAKPSYALDTLKNLYKGNEDPWLQRATQAGAINADRGAFMNNLKSAVKNASNPVLDKLSYAYHGALWDADKAMRTALFRDAVENGATDAQAAAKANKFLIDYNNLTPFEENVMSRIFPFYRWMKGNMPLQVEQWINNTPKQMLYQVAKNAAQQALTGQNLGADGKIDTGIVLADGSHVKIDPYSPGDEPLKLLRDGALPFLYSKVNPVVKEIAGQLSNKAYYPGSPLAPNGKESMANTAIRINGAPTNYNAAQTLAHALNNFLPESGVIGSAAGLKGGVNAGIDKLFGVPQPPPKVNPPMTAVEAITKALGGFTSHDNPVKDAYFQQKDQQAQKQGNLQYLRQIGQNPGKQMVRDAYKKIRMPVTSNSGQ